MPIDPPTRERLRELLCQLQATIRDRFLEARAKASHGSLAEITRISPSDTIYAIDDLTEEVVLAWFERMWPGDLPCQLVMEGLEERGEVTFPRDASVMETEYKVILDPIDGTRVIMFDKRSAWTLGGVARQLGPGTTLADIEVCAMTELPTTRQWRSDQVSAVRGGGIEALATNVLDRTVWPVELRPSRATDFEHSFGSIVKFIVEGKGLAGQLEEAFWKRLMGGWGRGSPRVFDDQYISTGGQFYELLAGRDRFLADIRPELYTWLGCEEVLCCHPYDCAAWLLLEEAGCEIGKLDGSPLDAPLDTVSPVSWVAFANPTLAELARPVLVEVVQEFLR